VDDNGIGHGITANLRIFRIVIDTGYLIDSCAGLVMLDIKIGSLNNGSITKIPLIVMPRVIIEGNPEAVAVAHLFPTVTAHRE